MTGAARGGSEAGGGLDLLPFQRTFQRAALDDQFDVAAMSGPRSLGKTYLCGRLLARCLTPGDPIHEPGADYILIAASLEQARITLSFVRPVLEPLGGFSFLDSAQRIAYRHKPTGTRLRVLSSDGKTAMRVRARLEPSGAHEAGPRAVKTPQGALSGGPRASSPRTWPRARPLGGALRRSGRARPRRTPSDRPSRESSLTTGWVAALEDAHQLPSSRPAFLDEVVRCGGSCFAAVDGLSIECGFERFV